MNMYVLCASVHAFVCVCVCVCVCIYGGVRGVSECVSRVGNYLIHLFLST